MNEDYYYLTNDENSNKSKNDYYDAKPFTRAQFVQKGDKVREHVRYFRLGAWCVGIFILIDIYRMYRINVEIDIESYIWLAGTLLFSILVLEVLVQVWGSMLCSVAGMLVSMYLMGKSFTSLLFLVPPGLFLMIVFAVQVGQTGIIEKYWKLYKKINID